MARSFLRAVAQAIACARVSECASLANSPDVRQVVSFARATLARPEIPVGPFLAGAPRIVVSRPISRLAVTGHPERLVWSRYCCAGFLAARSAAIATLLFECRGAISGRAALFASGSDAAA